MSHNQDQFNLLRQINNKPELSQRKLAKNLGFSLGKLNYCLKALKNKGLVKIQNFEKNDANIFPQKKTLSYPLPTKPSKIP